MSLKLKKYEVLLFSEASFYLRLGHIQQRNNCKQIQLILIQTRIVGLQAGSNSTILGHGEPLFIV